MATFYFFHQCSLILNLILIKFWIARVLLKSFKFFYTAVRVCEDPGQILHATRDGATGPQALGSVLYYTCNAGYHGGGSITCGYWATWSTLPICQSDSSGKSVDFNTVFRV